MARSRVLFLCTHNSARSQMAEEVQAKGWDCVITVCDDANERCPIVPGSVKRFHWSFEDPSQVAGDEVQRLAAFRRIRDRVLGERVIASSARWLP